MTNAKEKEADDSDKHKAKQKSHGKKWKKVENVNESITHFREPLRNTKSLDRQSSSGSLNSNGKKWKKVEKVNESITHFREPLRNITSRDRQSASGSQSSQTGIKENKDNGHGTEYSAPHSNAEETNELHSNETVKKKGKPIRKQLSRQQSRPAIVQVKEEVVDEVDPQLAFKTTVYQILKNGFGLAYGEDQDIKINVDNIFAILKALGLNPQNESVVDLVREACMESYGEIDTKDFERVVLALNKLKDDELWGMRLAEKEHLHRLAEAEKAKLEVERLRIEAEIKKAGFEKADEDNDEWAEYERKKQEAEYAVLKERKEDELYDNVKMAFQFIDADGDGYISTQDLYQLMMSLGEMLTDDDLFGMVNVVDLDCDGKVTFEDFKTFLLSKEENATYDAKHAFLNGPIVQQTIENTEDKQEDQQEEEVTGENSETTSDTKPETPEATTPATPSTPGSDTEGLSEEEKARRLRRKKSMLWGYMNTASKVVSIAEKHMNSSESTVIEEQDEEKENVDDEVFVSENKTENMTPEIVIENQTTIDDKQPDAEVTINDLQEASGQLDAIREEDEHSNYDIEHNGEQNVSLINQTEIKTTTMLENKRKLYSRQSSSASLKTRPNSAITESIGDSGIDTLDTMCGSEIREQPDTFDISDDESVTEKNESTRAPSSMRRNSKSPCGDFYSGNEDDDDDMIEAHHVYESLSRVSSSGSRESLDSLTEKRLPDDDAIERTRNFVNEHMYIEIPEELTEEVRAEAKLTNTRLSRAEMLQKAILTRANTSPALMSNTNNNLSGRPQTARPSVNGLPCSHIDIDLSCQTPPKANIKSFRKFSERVKSARGNRYGLDTVDSETGHSMSYIDLDVAEDSLPSKNDLRKFPMRPLTRPRSPVMRRVMSASSCRSRGVDSPTRGRETPTIDTDFEIVGQGRKTPTRSQSAVPGARNHSPTVRSSNRKLARPKTANIPYTSSKRMETALSDLPSNNNDHFNLVISQPFSNKNDHYPNKNQLTTFHHGFKSIWPIGRKMNVMKTKRPFSAFEMNSYSRSIERNELPFRPVAQRPCWQSQDQTDVFDVGAAEGHHMTFNRIKGHEQLATSSSLLELDLNQIRKHQPKLNKTTYTGLVYKGFAPRSVK